MNKVMLIWRAALTAMVLGVWGWAAEPAGKPQTTCPVMGGKINKSLYVDADGKRIYVCCAGCIKPIKADPGKYIKKLESAGVALEAVGKPQTTCPVMGGKINKKLYTDVNSKRVYVCCAGCIGTIEKDPAKYIGKLEAAGVTLEKAPTAKKR